MGDMGVDFGFKGSDVRVEIYGFGIYDFIDQINKSIVEKLILLVREIDRTKWKL